MYFVIIIFYILLYINFSITLGILPLKPHLINAYTTRLFQMILLIFCQPQSTFPGAPWPGDNTFCFESWPSPFCGLIYYLFPSDDQVTPILMNTSINYRGQRHRIKELLRVRPTSPCYDKEQR